MSKGALIFAHNNKEIDYIKIACINSLMIQKNLNVGVTLITDKGTLEWAVESMGQEFLDKCFEYIKIEERDYVFQTKNIRLYRDTVYNTDYLPFYNCNHWMAYDLTPYDETLFIDADYLIMSDALSNCWGSHHDFMINSNIQECMFERNRKNKLGNIDDMGINLYWATCIYFKKSELAQHAFQLVKHVFENYKFYRQLYLIPRGLFRNDYAFSIAVHMLNGFVDNGLISELPIKAIYKSFDNDDIAAVHGVNDVSLLLERPETSGDYIVTRYKGLDLHLMNKWAIIRHADKLLELYNV